MSSESSEVVNNSSTKDIELKEFSRQSDGYSDSASSADLTASSKGSMKQSETDEGKVNNVSLPFLNMSDENHHEFDIKNSLSSLKGISPGYLDETIRSSSNWQAHVLTKEASALEESTTRKVSSLDSLEGITTRRVSSLNALEESSARRVSSLDTLRESSIRKVSSLTSLDRPPVRQVSSLDSLERPATRRVSSLNALEESSAGRVSSLDSLECPSTKTVCSSYSAESSLPSNCRSHNSETNESLNIDPSTVQNGCCRALTWLCCFSKRIILSKYYLFFNVALLTISFSAIYMGAKYVNLCDGCVKLPLLVYSMGILGSLLLIFRIAVILSKRYFSPHLTGNEFKMGSAVIALPFYLFLLIETFTIFSCTPGFIPNRENFCNEIFYNYTYHVNVIVLFIIAWLLLIHTLGNFAPAEDE